VLTILDQSSFVSTPVFVCVYVCDCLQIGATTFEYHIARQRSDSGGATCLCRKLNTGRICSGGVVEVEGVSDAHNMAGIEVAWGWLW
jgi:hypothetical protein